MGNYQIVIDEIKYYNNRYGVEMHHIGLNEHIIIYAPEINLLQTKINIQKQKWSEKWKLNKLKPITILSSEMGEKHANLKTQEVTNTINTIDDLLIQTLSINHIINWENLKKFDTFEKLPSKPEPKIIKEYPPKPEEEFPAFDFSETLIKSKREKKINDYKHKYFLDVSDWEKEKENIDKINLKLDQEYELELQNWNKIISELEERNNLILKKIETFKDCYLNLNSDSIVEYCNMVLINSNCPEIFPKNFEIEYNPDNKILIVEYQLPSTEDFPKIKEIKFISSKNKLQEVHFSEPQFKEFYNDSLYKITLKTIYKLFNADAANALESISFNGWVKSINRATGNEVTNCILSILVLKNDFNKINLAKVDPKTCFKNLKGISSNELYALTPIPPILQISKIDKRFIESYNVTNQIDNSTNLAAMDWKDFEHLIRELFEKEFASHGGEVKVTQASRDGGVDAIAFDPDPIRGGKIVIQAKRYTNTVSVSAVRDLYGTLLNEGGTKGILVTTSNYGSDAYDFAKGKPLTLLNGSNLLHLLEKHGHHAKIDLKEAKKILEERNR